MVSISEQSADHIDIKTSVAKLCQLLKASLPACADVCYDALAAM